MNAPTPTTYAGWQAAYDHFNEALFAGDLPPCLITLQRKDHRCAGYYSPKRFGHMRDDGATTDEIVINPQHFKALGVQEALQTLVHEMTHLWQQHRGTPGRRGYHNHEWADKMESIGLMPSSTGKEGGARVGQRMGDYAIEGGLFLNAVRQLLDAGWQIDWYDRLVELLAEMQPEPVAAGAPLAPGAPVAPLAPRPNRSRRVRFVCPVCSARAWGKASLVIKCGQHDVLMAPE